MCICFYKFLLIKHYLLPFYFLNKLSLSLKLFSLDFQLIQQLGTLSLFLLNLRSGPFELSTQKRDITLIVIILILLLIYLFQTCNQLVGLVVGEGLLVLGRAILSRFELVDFGFELVFLLVEFLFLLLPHLFDTLELLLLVFENELPL